MSHPKVCPCPNCISSGSGRVVWLILAGAVTWGVIWAGNTVSAWAGRARLMAIGLAVAGVVGTILVAAIRGSVRSGRNVVVAETASSEPAPVVDDVKTLVASSSPAVASPAEVSPPRELETGSTVPRLRLVRQEEVA